MSDLIECDTIQLLEPQGDFLVDTAGTQSDMDERGEVLLHPGQVNVVVVFRVPKLNSSYNFEYLYIDAMGETNPGAIQIIPTVRTIEGFAAVFAGSPVEEGYVLHWRVTIVRTSALVQVDAPENIYILMPPTNLLTVPFANPRSGTNYGFSELRVENLIDPPAGQAIIRTQVVHKTISGFTIAVNPTPAPGSHYFLKVRTP